MVGEILFHNLFKISILNPNILAMEDAIKSILTTTVRDEEKRNEIGDLLDRKSTRLNSSHVKRSRMPSSA